MSKFEILCVTMHQNDFSKIKQMNIHSDVLFANQADKTSLDEIDFEGHCARMITTDTRGVGINRNTTLLYAKGDICLFADDDVTYNDDMEERVLAEFDAHPDADIIIFHLDTDSERKQVKYNKTKKCSRFCRMPWGAVRIAFRLSSVRKANIWFTTLFGGGCVFPSGEDSMWLTAAKRSGLTFYVSKETIGTVSFGESSWFTGFDEKMYYGKGAFYQAVHPHTVYLWMIYFAVRSNAASKLSFYKMTKWMNCGRNGYKKMLSFKEWTENDKEKTDICK